MIERIPPQNLDAEKSVIGSCLLSADAIDECDVTPEMFYSDAHRDIWQVIQDLNAAGKMIDAVTVGERLEAAGQFEHVGGFETLSDLIRFVPHAAHAAHYAEIVKDRWIARQVINTSNRVLREAYANQTDPADELIDSAQSEFATLEEKLTKQGASSLSAGLSDFLTDFGASQSPPLKTGLDDIDKLSPVRGGQLIILAARPSMGKTAIAGNIATGLAKNEHAVAFFSIEQSRIELTARLLASEADVPMINLHANTIKDDELYRVNLADAEMRKWAFFIDDDGYRTVGKIARALRVLDRRYGIDVAVVDYLQLVEPEDRRVNREQQVATMSRQFKRIAREMNIPIIVLAQLNRQLETRAKKVPQLSDLRESGSIEQDADIVWFIHRPEYYDPGDRPGEAELIVAKHRNGKTGVVKLSWNAATMTFRSLAQPWQNYEWVPPSGSF